MPDISVKVPEDTWRMSEIYKAVESVRVFYKERKIIVPEGMEVIEEYEDGIFGRIIPPSYAFREYIAKVYHSNRKYIEPEGCSETQNCMDSTMLESIFERLFPIGEEIRYKAHVLGADALIDFYEITPIRKTQSPIYAGIPARIVK